jgi:nucleotide-binding universal stress UspA family protein
MFHKILIPLDRSDLAEQAVEPALALGQPHETSFILLHVPSPVLIPAPDLSKSMPYAYHGQDLPHMEGQEYLNRIKYSHRDNDFLFVNRMYEGDPASAIVDCAKAENVDLIVMTTHGRSGLSRWVYGSVTEKVLSNAPCPVLALHQPRPMKHVLITLDGSQLAESALVPGLEIAKQLDATVTLMKVAGEPEPVDILATEQLNQYEAGLGTHMATRNAAEESLAYLQMFERTYQDMGVMMTTAVSEGNAADNILKFADDADVDLIVMATHGHTGLRRWVYGSVTEKVLRRTTANILVVRPS